MLVDLQVNSSFFKKGVSVTKNTFKPVKLETFGGAEFSPEKIADKYKPADIPDQIKTYRRPMDDQSDEE